MVTEAIHANYRLKFFSIKNLLATCTSATKIMREGKKKYTILSILIEVDAIFL
jgi:hypothetical protein